MRLPLPLESNYDSTRDIPQRKVNVYPHGKRGWRQDPGLTLFSSVVSLQNLTEHSEGSTFSSNDATGLVFGDSGTKAYVTDRSGASSSTFTVYELALSTPYDLSTETLTSSTTINVTGDEDDMCTIIGFNADGTKMLGVFYDNTGSGSVHLHSWDITAWDSSTASSTPDDTGLVVTGSFRDPAKATVKPDGTAVFIAGPPSSTIYEYSLSVAFDVTSTITAGESLSTSGVSGSIQSLDFTSGGTQMYAMSVFGADRPVNLFEFSTAWSLSTGEFLGALENSQLDSSATGLAVANSDSLIAFLIPSKSNDLAWFDIVSGTPRGAIEMGGVLYVVVGTSLYSVASDGVTTEIDTVLGSTRVVMETDGLQLVINTGASGNTIYRYTTAGGLTTVTDADIEDSAKSSAYTDKKFYHDQSSGRFIGSANDDATSYSTDDRAEAESFADDVLRMYAHNRMLYAIGESSTEAWYTSGEGRPPVDRQAVIERGIIGTHAITSIDDRIYFVDQYRRPNVMAGAEYDPIYKPGVAEAWDTYATVSDCYVISYSYRQMTFVEFHFPTEGKSWSYHADTGKWREREDSSNGQFRAMEYVNVYDKVLAVDRENAKIYQYSETVYQDDGSAITRVVDTGLITSEIYGDPRMEGREMEMNNLYLTVDATGAGSVTVSFSKDLSTFPQARTISVTAGPQTRTLESWGEFREGVVRVSCSDNIGLSITDLAADLSVLDG